VVSGDPRTGALANTRLITTMEGLAMTDGLTGLRNARFFDTQLEQELASAERDREPLSVLMIDIDNFKKFNDTYGHPAGDEALRVFGRTVRASVRTSDLPARYGGEEFVVALRHTNLEGATAVAEKLRDAVSRAIVEIGPGRYGRMTISVGVAEADLGRVDQKGLLASADAALYRAKAAGRNRVVQATVEHVGAELAASESHDVTARVGAEPSNDDAQPAGRSMAAHPKRSPAIPVPLAARRRRRPTTPASAREAAPVEGHG
jgi:diguanylate cyclase (GGDEF)-like protein